MLGFIILILLSMSAPAFADTFPGGFIEQQGQFTRQRMTNAQIDAFMPAGRVAFNFPSPYNTRGVRITQPSDCGGQDCTNYIGYSYWANMNNHVNDPTMLIYVGFDVSRGGDGINIFQYNKTTETVTKLGWLFGPSPSGYRNMNCSVGCYFSGTMPTKIYFIDTVLGNSKQLVHIDALTGVTTIVWDIRDGSVAGCNATTCPFTIYQPHSSKDDAFHSMTLRDSGGTALGCLVRKTSAPTQTIYYPKIATFDECSLDKSGRWTISLEYTASGPNLEPTYNRIFDNTTVTEANRITGPANTLGHLDTGFNYAVGADNTNLGFPNATIYWVYPSTVGGTVHFDVNWQTPPIWGISQWLHLSHVNAQAGQPSRLQMVCGSGVSSVSPPAQDEVTCARIDGARRQLVVAPIITDLNASGGAWQGAPYALQPKGNIDVTGRYFIWTSNLQRNRMDAFIVKIPQERFDEKFATNAAPVRDVALAKGTGTTNILIQAPRGLTLTFFDLIEGLLLLWSLIKYRAKIVWAYKATGEATFRFYWRWKVRRWLRDAPIMLTNTGDYVDLTQKEQVWQTRS